MPPNECPAVVRKRSLGGKQPQGFSGVRSWTLMCFLGDWHKALRQSVQDNVLLDSLRLVPLTCRSRCAVEAENLFPGKPLLFQERKVKPRRAGDFTRWLMSLLSQSFHWRNALVVVKPETLIRCHRQAFM